MSEMGALSALKMLVNRVSACLGRILVASFGRPLVGPKLATKIVSLPKNELKMEGTDFRRQFLALQVEFRSPISVHQKSSL